MGYRKTLTQLEFKRDIFSKAQARFDSPDLTFPEFIREAWPVLEPANPLIPGWHTDYVAEYLTAVTNGEINKLLINIPPRNAKSMFVTTLWPVWSWIKRPSMRWIFCSYSASLSVKHSVDRRRLIESDWFQERWGGIIRLAEDQNQKNEYENTRRGHMITTSVGGTITGKGGDAIVEDDMLNPQEADSHAARRASRSMHKDVLFSRLDNPKTGIRVCVEQRTHYEDVSGYILRVEGDWEHISLPLRFEKKTVLTFPISKKQITMQAGEFLNRERQGQKEYENAKRTMGTRTFNAQYQQNPTSDEGNILQRGWWQYWKGRHQDLKCELYIQSWDMAFKDNKTSSFVVGQVWGKKGARYYLIDQIRDRMDFTSTLAAVINMSARWPMATAKLVEDKANGTAVMNVLQNKIDGLVPIDPAGGKFSRAQSVAPLVEAGNVFLPDPLEQPWVADFIEECAAFKGETGEVNDQVDSFSQALVRLREVDSAIYDGEPQDESFIEEDRYNMDKAGGFVG